MAEVKRIAKTVAEAQVGEWLWHMEPQRSRYDAAGKYEGRGVWSLVQVSGLTRLSVLTSYDKFDRQSGALRPRSGYGMDPYVAGANERTAGWWLGQASTLADRIKRCCDPETLKAIAFVLGFEGPPDFSIDPDAPARAAIASMETVEGGGADG